MKPEIWNRRTGQAKPLERNRQTRKVTANENLGIWIDNEETQGSYVHEGGLSPSTTHEKTDQRHVQRPAKKIESTEFQRSSRPRNEGGNHGPQKHREYAVGRSEEDAQNRRYDPTESYGSIYADKSIKDDSSWNHIECSEGRGQGYHSGVESVLANLQSFDHMRLAVARNGTVPNDLLKLSYA